MLVFRKEDMKKRAFLSFFGRKFCSYCCCVVLLSDSTLVESKFLSLQDVTIHSSTLARSGRDNSIQSTGLELLLKSRLNLAHYSNTSCLLLGNAVAFLLLGSIGSSLLLASSAKGLTVVCLIPLSERGSVDLNNGRFGEGVGTDEFVVGRVVGHGNHTDFAGKTLRAPGEVAGLEAEGTEFLVTTADTDGVDALGANTGVGWLTALLESPGCPPPSVSTPQFFLSLFIYLFFFFLVHSVPRENIHTSSCGSELS